MPSRDDILATNPQEQYCATHDIIFTGRCPQCAEEGESAD